jgi:hypothetical protein
VPRHQIITSPLVVIFGRSPGYVPLRMCAQGMHMHAWHTKALMTHVSSSSYDYTHTGHARVAYQSPGRRLGCPKGVSLSHTHTHTHTLSLSLFLFLCLSHARTHTHTHKYKHKHMHRRSRHPEAPTPTNTTTNTGTAEKITTDTTTITGDTTAMLMLVPGMSMVRRMAHPRVYVRILGMGLMCAVNLIEVPGALAAASCL